MLQMRVFINKYRTNFKLRVGLQSQEGVIQMNFRPYYNYWFLLLVSHCM